MSIERTQGDGHRDLLTLRNFLDDLPHDKFHMPAWTAQDATEHSCGTAGCAAGWAATIFQSKGWKLEYSVMPQLGMMPTYEDFYGVRAFSEFFGIDRDDAGRICADLASYCIEYHLAKSRDITPRHAADRITKVLQKYAPHLLEEEQAPVREVEAAV